MRIMQRTAAMWIVLLNALLADAVLQYPLVGLEGIYRLQRVFNQNSSLIDYPNGVYLLYVEQEGPKDGPPGPPEGQLHERLDKYSFSLQLGNVLRTRIQHNDTDQSASASPVLSTRMYPGPKMAIMESNVSDIFESTTSVTGGEGEMALTIMGDRGSMIFRRKPFREEREVEKTRPPEVEKTRPPKRLGRV